MMLDTQDSLAADLRAVLDGPQRRRGINESRRPDPAVAVLDRARRDLAALVRQLHDGDGHPVAAFVDDNLVVVDGESLTIIDTRDVIAT